MTTQRDRLAALVHEADCGCSEVIEDGGRMYRLADRLIARGVRVIPPGYWEVEGDVTPDDIANVRKAIEEADGQSLIVCGRLTLRWRDLAVVER